MRGLSAWTRTLVMTTNAMVISQVILDSSENFSSLLISNVTLENKVDHGDQVQVDSFAGEQTYAFLKKGKGAEGVERQTPTQQM